MTNKLQTHAVPVKKNKSKRKKIVILQLDHGTVPRCTSLDGKQVAHLNPQKGVVVGQSGNKIGSFRRLASGALPQQLRVTLA